MYQDGIRVIANCSIFRILLYIGTETNTQALNQEGWLKIQNVHAQLQIIPRPNTHVARELPRDFHLWES